MKLLIHDINSSGRSNLSADCTEEKDWMILADDGTIHSCIGCFGCWIKTPGRCVIQDGYENMGALFAMSDEVTLISRCCYGGPSPFIKNVLDRSIPYLHPDFVIKNGEMHHRQRYHRTFSLSVLFYGENLLDEEKRTAEEWVSAVSDNFYCEVERVEFRAKPEDWEGLL